MKYNPIVDFKLQNTFYATPELEEIYAIGDVHGCGDTYNKLIDLCKADAKANGKTAVIIQLGDMIDRGPDFVDLILNDRADIKIMGNHEYNFIIEHYEYKRCTSKSRHTNHNVLEDTPEDVTKALIGKLLDRQSYLVCYHGDEKFVFSHAPINNVEKGINAIEHKMVHNMTLSDFCMRSTEVGELLDEDNVTYIHGHQSWGYKDIEEQIDEQLDRTARIFNLDSNCVYGDELIALRISDMDVIRVKSNIRVDRFR